MLIVALQSCTIQKLAFVCQKSSTTRMSRLTMENWKQFVWSKKWMAFALQNEQRRRKERAVMLALHHWRLALGARRQLWSSFERMRFRSTRRVVTGLFEDWRDQLVSLPAHDSRVTLALQTLRDWRNVTQLRKDLCKMSRLMMAQRMLLQLPSLILLWRQNVRLRQAKFGAYAHAKRNRTASQVLRDTFSWWTDRVARRKTLHDWTINLYSQKRLQRIQQSISNRHQQALLRLVFAGLGQDLLERKGFREKFGELRAEFVCTRALVPASPSAPFGSVSIRGVGSASGPATRIPRTPSPLPPVGRFETISEQVAPSYLQAQVEHPETQQCCNTRV